MNRITKDSFISALNGYIGKGVIIKVSFRVSCYDHDEVHGTLYDPEHFVDNEGFTLVMAGGEKRCFKFAEIMSARPMTNADVIDALGALKYRIELQSRSIQGARNNLGG